MKGCGKGLEHKKGEKLKLEGHKYVGQDVVLVLKGAFCGMWMRRVIGDKDVLCAEMCSPPAPTKKRSPNPQYLKYHIWR